MDTNQFIQEKVNEIRKKIGKKKALVALSGGVDSAVVTVLAHQAIKKRLITVFIDSGLMRESEAKWVQYIFDRLGIQVIITPAQKEFLNNLKGIRDPEKKREIIEWCFYGNIIPTLCKKFDVKYWLQGTIKTDIEETQAGIKLQHNVRPDLYPEKYGLPPGIAPLKELRKPEVKEVAKALGLPKEISERPPFLGPGLAGRIMGAITPQKLGLIRKATAIVEEEFEDSIARIPILNPFQYFPVLLEDKAVGIKDGKRAFGRIIAIRAIDSTDARTAEVTELFWFFLRKLTKRIIEEIPEVARVVYDITPKPPATIEYI